MSPEKEQKISSIFGDIAANHDQSEAWLKLRLEKLKELRMELKVRLLEMQKTGIGDNPPTSKWCMRQFLIVYSRLTEAFEVFCDINDLLLGQKIVLNDVFEYQKQNKDALEYFRTSMEQTKKTLNEGK